VSSAPGKARRPRGITGGIGDAGQETNNKLFGRLSMGFFENLRKLIGYHDLVSSMVYRSIHSRYRQSVLGLAWAVVRPLATVLIFTVVFSFIARFPSDGLPYPLFAFGALLPWNLFTTALNSGVPSLVNNAGLVTKIYFPREILPLSSIVATLVDFLISSVLLVGMLVYYKIGVSVEALFAVPILAITVVFTFGLVLLLSVINVWFRDVSQALTLLTQLWMYLTPVVYPLTMVPERYRLIYGLNPMVGVVEGFRACLLRGQRPDLRLLGISCAVAVAMFVIGYAIFKEREYEFADVI